MQRSSPARAQRTGNAGSAEYRLKFPGSIAAHKVRHVGNIGASADKQRVLQ
ncbi:MAG: hypothetical protein IPK19_25065 [Chloroflexi bacterium]|nr:hypothetical protein [Chloroflexota bacterium]